MRYRSARAGVVASAMGAMVLGAATRSIAVPVTFDFEDQVATDNNFNPPGALTTLTMIKGGITATMTRAGGKRFDITNATAGGFPLPAGQGDKALSPFFDTTPGAFVVNFSQPLGSVSVLEGDFQPSDADSLSLQAFSGLNGTGTLLGTATNTLPDNTGSGWLFRSLSLSGLAGAQSVVMDGGSPSFPTSVFFDNLTVNAVPEPATLCIAGGAFVLITTRRARRH